MRGTMGVRVLRGEAAGGGGAAMVRARGTVSRGREVGRREVEGSAVRRRRVDMPCGFAAEVEPVTSERTDV